MFEAERESVFFSSLLSGSAALTPCKSKERNEQNEDDTNTPTKQTHSGGGPLCIIVEPPANWSRCVDALSLRQIFLFVFLVSRCGLDNLDI